MARKVGIIAYGSQEDRSKLELLAKASKTSASQWIIDRIRREYASLIPTKESKNAE